MSLNLCWATAEVTCDATYAHAHKQMHTCRHTHTDRVAISHSSFGDSEKNRIREEKRVRSKAHSLYHEFREIAPPPCQKLQSNRHVVSESKKLPSSSPPLPVDESSVGAHTMLCVYIYVCMCDHGLSEGRSTLKTRRPTHHNTAVPHVCV